MGIKRGICQPQKDWRDAKETAHLREFIHGRACECHSRGGATVLDVLVGWGGDRVIFKLAGGSLPRVIFLLLCVVCKGWSSLKKGVYRVSGRCEVRLSNADFSWFISLMAGTKELFFEFHCSSSHHFPTSTPPPNFTGAMKTGPLVV